MWTFEAPPLDYWKARYGFTPDPAAGWTTSGSPRCGCPTAPPPSCPPGTGDDQPPLRPGVHHSVSTPDSNFQELGFVARTRPTSEVRRALRRPAPGDQGRHRQIQGAITAKTAATRWPQRNAAIAAIEKACARRPSSPARSSPTTRAAIYSLYRFRRFNDLRLVMAPEEAISFFGGDPDNFTYPRYDLDLCLLRVYENGQPVPAQGLPQVEQDGREGGRPGLRHRQPGLHRPGTAGAPCGRRRQRREPPSHRLDRWSHDAVPPLRGALVRLGRRARPHPRRTVRHRHRRGLLGRHG